MGDDHVPKMQIRMIEKAFNVRSHNRIELLRSFTHLFKNCRQAAAYLGMMHTLRKCSPYVTDSESSTGLTTVILYH